MTLPHLFGPRLGPRGVTFRLWAPAAKSVQLVTARAHPMRRDADGWYEVLLADAHAGTRYRFRIDDDIEVPDPASAFQPEDVHGASEVIDHSYQWKAAAWRGRPWHEAVMLELHVGTFTPAGTFRAAIERLDSVAATGFTAIELMPVGDFFGRRNWGYDGVLPYAPDSAYGRPEDLRALVDAAHQRGLMVFLDVVYNHFGPEGNYLGRYAPSFFSSSVATPWGAAIDYDVPEVRAFAIHNALHWLAHYRFDGLRLDAVHAIVKPGTPSILEQLSRAVGEFAQASERQIHLVLENDNNAANLLDPAPGPPRGRYRAQWNDDYHHAWHVLLTGEQRGYYRDYAADPRRAIARVLESGFAYQGEPSPHRLGNLRGEPSGHLPPTAFVSFLQNQDQIGNRPRGERLEVLAPAPAVEAALAVMLLSPMPPLMFMGEEWGAKQPFAFFCDFQGALAEAVRKGRREEFKDDYRQQGDEADIPDPLAEQTFRAAALDWAERAQPGHRRRLAAVKDLIAARVAHVIPHLAELSSWRVEARWEESVLVAVWHLATGTLSLVANLSATSVPRPDLRPGVAIWGGPAPRRLAPWGVHASWSDV